MFCSLRENQPTKTTQQLLLEFYNDIEEVAIEILLREIVARQVREFLEVVKRNGYNTIDEVSKTWIYYW